MKARKTGLILLAGMMFASSAFALSEEQMRVADATRAQSKAKKEEVLQVLWNLEQQADRAYTELVGGANTVTRGLGTVGSILSAGTIVLLNRGTL